MALPCNNDVVVVPSTSHGLPSSSICHHGLTHPCIGDFWVWGKVIENLAAIGYDSNNMFMASYDWRMSPSKLESRDRYFTKLKVLVENAVLTNQGRKVVLMSHSMGSQVVMYFLQWVESPLGGAAPGWVERHLHALTSIGGSFLGAPKSLASLLSGEMKDTADLDRFSSYVVDKVLNRAERLRLFRSWGCLGYILPKGGTAVWGDATSTPDGLEATAMLPAMLNVFDPEHAEAGTAWPSNYTAAMFRTFSATQALDVLFADSQPAYRELLLQDFSFGTPATLDRQRERPAAWSNPLESVLPMAPNFTIYCMYGVGQPTERGFVYRHQPDSNDTRYQILTALHSPSRNISNGVLLTEGDATVPLVSLGYMCAKGWKLPQLNPGGVRPVLREFQHNPQPSHVFDLRGGISSADHVDIMGNNELIASLLHIVANQPNVTYETVHSGIRQIADRVQLPGLTS